jgi:hypothetical protein
MIDRPLETLSEALIMENWLNIFLLILFGALANLIVAFIVLRALAGVFGVPEEKNNSRRALLALLTIVPVAGVAGAPFFLIPFAGPFFGIALSCFVAAMMFGEKYELPQGQAAKIILPTVLVIFALSGVILYYGIPMI